MLELQKSELFCGPIIHLCLSKASESAITYKRSSFIGLEPSFIGLEHTNIWAENGIP